MENTRLLCKITKDIIAIHGASKEQQLKLPRYKRIFCEKKTNDKIPAPNKMGSKEEENEKGYSKMSSQEGSHAKRSSTGCNKQSSKVDSGEKVDSEDAFAVLDLSRKKEKDFADKNVSGTDDCNKNIRKRRKLGRPERFEKKSQPELSDSSTDVDLEIDCSSDFEFEIERRSIAESQCKMPNKYKRAEKFEEKNEARLSGSVYSFSDADVDIDCSSDFEFEIEKRSIAESQCKMAKKYKKLKKLEKKSEPRLSDSADSSSDVDLEIDCSSDFEFEIERRLEENVQKNNLIGMNIKSILHTVIMNKHLDTMINDSLKSSGDVDGEPAETVYGPKMTRSKMKEVLEETGISPWPLPSTTSNSEVSILDIPFEEEDDEEDDDYDYYPDEDVTAEGETNDNTESDNSSLLCSPSNSLLPKSPQETEELDMSCTEEDEEKDDDETEGTIAHHTRSKLSLHDTSLTELEADFVAPDIEDDICVTECHDEDWQDFLKGLTESECVEDSTEDLDDDSDDPDYNCLKKDEIDEEDFRDDTSVRVTKKELHNLLVELFNDDGNDEEETVVQSPPLMNMDFSVSGQPSDVNITVTTKQEAIIREQIKQHVQLLSQMILLTQNRAEYTSEHINANLLLNELHHFGNNSLAGEKSVFRVCNLESSLQLIEVRKTETFGKGDNSKELSALKNLFINNSCFLYPQLLPVVNMRPKGYKKNKCTFYPSQDNLLALGFEQFRHFTSYTICKFIRQFLLPCKTEKQIRTRIKNLRSKRAKDNAVKTVQLTKKLPEDFPHATLTSVQEMVAPKENADHPSAPIWLKRIVDPSPTTTHENTKKANKYIMTDLTQEMKRHAVIVALCAKHRDLEISNFLLVARSFVHKVRKELEASGGDVSPVAKRKKHSQRSDTIRTPAFVQLVQNIIDDEPRKSMRAISRDLQVSGGTIRTVVLEDIRYRSYVKRKNQFMSMKTQENRLIRSKRLLNKVKNPEEPGMLWFFSDEKYFEQDLDVNRKNDRWLCEDPSEDPRVMHTDFGVSVMVLGVVSNEGQVMPPFFFPQGLRVNAAGYIEVLETVVKPWIELVANGRPYVFQQDCAPSHKAPVTQEWMADNFHDHVTPNMWPPNSPDLNPMDYYVWSVVERETNQHPHKTKDSVKAAIIKIMSEMNKDHLIRACQRFQNRIQAVIDAEGGYIE